MGKACDFMLCVIVSGDTEIAFAAALPLLAAKI